MQNGIEECERCPNNTPSPRRRRCRLDDLHARASVFREFKTSRRSRGPITCMRVWARLIESTITQFPTPHKEQERERRESTHKFQSFPPPTWRSFASHFPSNPLARYKHVGSVRACEKSIEVCTHTHTATTTTTTPTTLPDRSSRRVRQGIRRLLFIK